MSGSSAVRSAPLALAGGRARRALRCAKWPLCSQAASAKQRGQGSRQDPKIAAEGPALEILHVEPDHLVERELVAAADLPQAGYSRSGVEAAQMPRLIELELVGQRRARSDDTHLAADH